MARVRSADNTTSTSRNSPSLPSPTVFTGLPLTTSQNRFRHHLRGPGTGVPDFQSAIPATRRQARAVGAEGHGQNIALVASECKGFLTALRVPDLNRKVTGGRSEALAVGAERHGIHDVVVS